MSESEAEEAIHRQLTESGEKERLKKNLQKDLEDCGWREQVKLLNKSHFFSNLII